MTSQKPVVSNTLDPPSASNTCRPPPLHGACLHVGLGKLCLKLPVLRHASNSWKCNYYRKLYYAHIMLNYVMAFYL